MQYDKISLLNFLVTLFQAFGFLKCLFLGLFSSLQLRGCQETKTLRYAFK